MTSNALVADIQKILHNARAKSYAAVNFAMVEAYWQIGRRIVEEEQKGKNRADYGADFIKDPYVLEFWGFPKTLQPRRKRWGPPSSRNSIAKYS